MKIDKFEILDVINKIREDIGHKKSELDILDIRIDEQTGNMLILTPDRPEKSAVIGKGGWVVGLLREELGVNSIHVEANSDFLVPKYRMELALKKLENIIPLYGSFERIP
ncbi:MAG: ATPase, partial [Methanobacterium sp.]